MSTKYPLGFRRRIGRHWAARITSLTPVHMLRHLRGRLVAAIEQALQGMVGGDHLLVQIPIRTTAAQRRRQLLT